MKTHRCTVSVTMNPAEQVRTYHPSALQRQFSTSLVFFRRSSVVCTAMRTQVSTLSDATVSAPCCSHT